MMVAIMMMDYDGLKHNGVFLPYNSWYTRDGGTVNSPATQVYITHGMCNMAGRYKYVIQADKSSIRTRGHREFYV
jgi:hypothetical protein